jgi:hypothetical protein
MGSSFGGGVSGGRCARPSKSTCMWPGPPGMKPRCRSRASCCDLCPSLSLFMSTSLSGRSSEPQRSYEPKRGCEPKLWLRPIERRGTRQASIDCVHACVGGKAKAGGAHAPTSPRSIFACLYGAERLCAGRHAVAAAVPAAGELVHVNQQHGAVVHLRVRGCMGGAGRAWFGAACPARRH